MADDSYLTAEARARRRIDEQLQAAGWKVLGQDELDLSAGVGVAVREVRLNPVHGQVDYLLYVKGRAAGVLEAKPEGATLTGVTWQSEPYTKGLPREIPAWMRPLPFEYQSTGTETRFRNHLDPVAMSRDVFTFHRPETLVGWLDDRERDPDRPTLRSRLHALPPVDAEGLWPAQEEAVLGTERHFKDDRQRTLIQMTMGAGKTFAAADLAYRMVKHAGARRVLFLVDRSSLGTQAKDEFERFEIPDSTRRFTDSYIVQHLTSNSIDLSAKVVISTIQRLYSILKGEPTLDPEREEVSSDAAPGEPVTVTYNRSVPIEMFDLIVVDECHRSIYGAWRQVLDYFDSFIVGLTATPNNQALAFFDHCVASRYSHPEAVADGVNVDYDVYRIRTEITETGGLLEAGLFTQFRDRDTRAKRWAQLEEDLPYNSVQLDHSVVGEDQIRLIIRTFKQRLPVIFPGRRQVPKTLILAKNDSHADDIVKIVREEFDKEDKWAAKITYRSTGRKPQEMINEFSNSPLPRIAVSVDMMATGTDIRPLECVFFMRSTRSRTLFEQMKGRGVRVINDVELQGVTEDATSKTHFVIVDAVGVTERTDMQETQPINRRPGAALEALLEQVALGDRDPEALSTIASRLARFDKQLTTEERVEIEDLAGRPLAQIVGDLLGSVDPDVVLEAARAEAGTDQPSDEQIAETRQRLVDAAASPLAHNPQLRKRIVDLRRLREQVIDEASQDRLIAAGFTRTEADRAIEVVQSFERFVNVEIGRNKAIQLLCDSAGSDRVSFSDLRDLRNELTTAPYSLSVEKLWSAYETLEKTPDLTVGPRTLTDLVSLVRFARHLDADLVPHAARISNRFEAWLAERAAAGVVCTDEQLIWLRHMRDNVATSLAIGPDDFDYAPFVSLGGLGRAHEVFNDLDALLDDLNETLGQ